MELSLDKFKINMDIGVLKALGFSDSYPSFVTIKNPSTDCLELAAEGGLCQAGTINSKSKDLTTVKDAVDSPSSGFFSLSVKDSLDFKEAVIKGSGTALGSCGVAGVLGAVGVTATVIAPEIASDIYETISTLDPESVDEMMPYLFLP